MDYWVLFTWRELFNLQSNLAALMFSCKNFFDVMERWCYRLPVILFFTSLVNIFYVVRSLIGQRSKLEYFRKVKLIHASIVKAIVATMFCILLLFTTCHSLLYISCYFEIWAKQRTKLVVCMSQQCSLIIS